MRASKQINKKHNQINRAKQKA